MENEKADEMLVGEEELVGEGGEGQRDTATAASEQNAEVNKLVVQVSSCRVQGVTVYNDRAEVTRSVPLVDLPAGTTEVRIVGLSSKVDRNSVRVLGGKGEALILEVSYNTKWEPKTKDDGSERSALERELEQVTQQLARQEEAFARTNKESEWMDKWATGLAEPRKTEAAADLCPPQSLDQATAFMHFYQKSLTDLDERRAVIKSKRDELVEQRTRVSRALAAIVSGDTEEIHEVAVLLTTESMGNVELALAYVVMDASWQAAYDARVSSSNSELNLTYYGVITNNSLDHWHDAPLSLSTAQPSVGGAPPDLSTKFVGFVASHRSWNRYHQKQSNSMLQMDFFEESKQCEKSAGFDDYDAQSSSSEVGVMTSSVKESSFCATFEIPRRATILSDSKPHKVTIRIIGLKARFTYVLTPKHSTHAYLKASIINDSERYTFLAGEMNVFMDGNFVSKSAIKSVSPAESFVLYLGVDDAIKVTYPPGVFFNDKQGLLRRSNLKARPTHYALFMMMMRLLTVKHMITVKNTKATDVHIAVYDQLPKSNDGQIKVRLVKPTISEVDSSVVLTAANNVKWKLDLPAGKQVQLPFTYQLEWPLGQEINA